MLLNFGETLLPTGFSRLTVGNSSLDFVEIPLQSGNLPLQKGNSLLQNGDNLLHSRQTLPTNPPTPSTFDFAPNHTNQPQEQSQKSLPTNTSKKEISKNAPTHNKNKTEKALHDKIVSLVEQMIEAKKEIKISKTDKDKTYNVRKCISLDNAIDAEVYKLYDLSEDETSTTI